MLDIERAEMFATSAHEHQKYAKVFPYTYHLREVASILEHVGAETNLVVAGWLHDTIEDTNTSYSDIKNMFGSVVAQTVYDVTSELGKTRHERNVRTYPKIASNPNAKIVKLADRIANMHFGKNYDAPMFRMYMRELAVFKNFLKPTRDEHQYFPEIMKLWKILDGICE